MALKKKVMVVSRTFTPGHSQMCMPFADLLTAMEAAVLPDEEDLMMSPSGQPQSSRSAPLPHSSEAGQHATASIQQPPPHDAVQHTAEQPQSSRSALQSDIRAGQGTTVLQAPAQQPSLPRAADRVNEMRSMHASRSQAAYSTAPPASAASPDLLVRPFQSLLSTPERDARMVRSPGVPHRLHVHEIDPDHVWVDGRGAMLRVKPPQPAGALGQPLAMVATQVDSEGLVALQQQQAAPAARRPLVKSVPHLSTMQDVPEFWQIWQEGNGMEQAALKDLPAKQIRAQKQRYSEWSKAARALEGQAQEEDVTPVQMAITLEAARISEGSFVASFLKVLGSRWLAKQRAVANAALPADEVQE